MRTLFGIGIAAMLAMAAAPLWAQEAAAIDSRLEARKVVRAADGKETFAPADAAKPGDVIEYVVTYRNTTAQPVRNLEATLPIPAHTEIVPGTARPASAKASVDSIAFAQMPLRRKALRNGREIEEAVPLGEYRYLRWHAGELAGGKSAVFRARVKVLDNARAPDTASAPGGGK